MSAYALYNGYAEVKRQVKLCVSNRICSTVSHPILVDPIRKYSTTMIPHGHILHISLRVKRCLRDSVRN
jgi:hypothetical protein